MRPTTTSEGAPRSIRHTGQGPSAPRPVVYTLRPSVVSPSIDSGVVMSVENGLCWADVGVAVRSEAVAESENTTAIRLMRADDTRGADPGQSLPASEVRHCRGAASARVGTDSAQEAYNPRSANLSSGKDRIRILDSYSDVLIVSPG